MAKFFNDNSNLDNNGNSFFPNNEQVIEEEDTPSFVSAADADQMINEVASQNAKEEIYQAADQEDNIQSVDVPFNNYQEEYLDESAELETEALEDGYDEPDQLMETNEEDIAKQDQFNNQEFSEQVFPQPGEENVVSNEDISETNEEELKDNSMFANAQTTYVDDNSYKGVDNTGKTGEEIQNPVYTDAFEKNDVNVSGNILAVLLVLFETILSPGKSIVRNTKKYVNGKKTAKVFINIIIYEFIFSLIGHVIGGCFVDKMMYGEYRKVLDFSNVLKINYLNVLTSTAIVCFGIVLLLALFNYASSFFSNKGLSFGTYLLIAVLSFFPLVLTINTFIPILSVMSLYIAIGAIIIAFLFSFILYINALWTIMEFKNDNGKIFYTLISFIMITIVIVIIILVFFEDYVNAIKVIFK
jgi:hypothetical protein